MLLGHGAYDPKTTPLDADGQGIPYETYAFGAQVAEVDVDVELGTVKVRRVVAAHDVGRAINPTLVEGQIQGGIVQGLGMALMEAYVPGRTDTWAVIRRPPFPHPSHTHRGNCGREWIRPTI